MKIGKLKVNKAKSDALGEHLVIKVENVVKDEVLQELFTIDDNEMSLKVSKATALKLAVWIKKNIKL